MKSFWRQNKKYLVIESIILLLIVVLLILFVGFKNKSEESPKTNNQPNDKDIDKEISIINVNSKSRPIAVMINNASDARPYQKGLQKAYIVYEMINYIDGTTRFLALFKDQNIEEIGPIRSARHYHLDYALENDAIFVHWGYSPLAQSDIKSLKINNINGLTYGSNANKDNIKSNYYFWTAEIPGVNISHRRFTSSELINKAISKLKYNTETEIDNLFNYSVQTINNKDADNTVSASKVEIYYSKDNYVTYNYDEKTHSYLRSVKGVSHKDALTNEQLKVTNIITYQIKNNTISGDTASRQELQNIGGGDGYYITNGYATKIKWEKECRSCQTKYSYLDGKEITLNDGNTFIQIQPMKEKLEIS